GIVPVNGLSLFRGDVLGGVLRRGDKHQGLQGDLVLFQLDTGSFRQVQHLLGGGGHQDQVHLPRDELFVGGHGPGGGKGVVPCPVLVGGLIGCLHQGQGGGGTIYLWVSFRRQAQSGACLCEP